MVCPGLIHLSGLPLKLIYFSGIIHPMSVNKMPQVKKTIAVKKKAYENRIKEVIDKAEEEYKMEYVPLFERSARRKGIREGIKRGIKRGIESKVKETAMRMLNKGFDIDAVIEITGLDKTELGKIASTAATH